MISIIVPTASSNQAVEHLLHSVRDQSLSPELYEVIIVYNNCKRTPFETMASTKNTRTLFSPYPGVNNARNLGLLHAQGQYLLFLDDDCVLHNKEYLQNLFKIHTDHAQWMSAGGPYLLPANAGVFDKAYHYNMSKWLENHRLQETTTTVLLGGNATYKHDVFRQLRFPPGIRYGGSETPLNLSVAQKFGPHQFLPILSLQHNARMTFFSFIKKAYLQGKGAAFSEKFYPLEQSNLNEKSASVIPWFYQTLLFIYDFCFMVGYRTSIFERKSPLASLLEEAGSRLFSPLKSYVNDFCAARQYHRGIPAISQTTTKEDLVNSSLLRINSKNTILKTLLGISKKRFENSRLYVESTEDSCFGISADSFFKELHKTLDYFSISSENLKWQQKSVNSSFHIEDAGEHFLIFDKTLSSKFEGWKKNPNRPVDLPDNNAIALTYASDVQWKKKLSRYSCAFSSFHFLDGIFVPKVMWRSYLESNHQEINHFSWNEFITGRSPTKSVSIPDKVFYNASALTEQATAFFFAKPSSNFYTKYFSVLGPRPERRARFLRFFLHLKSIFTILPPAFLESVQRLAHSSQKKWNSLQFEVQETSSLSYKIAAVTWNHAYWFCHRCYWMFFKVTTVVGAFVVWRFYDLGVLVYLALNRIFWGLAEVFWLFNSLFWLFTELLWIIHNGLWKLTEIYWFIASGYWVLHRWIVGPTIGFFVSLFDEPAYIKRLPFKERYKHRFILFAKKWAWLALRTVRLK
jgi:glycosyltransferase involved in cell wall biosynthesis